MAGPKVDGGPAFARAGDQYSGSDSQDGMSLRDYFAAAAVTGVLQARAALAIRDGRDPFGSEQDVEEIAEDCYEIADALLAERKV